MNMDFRPYGLPLMLFVLAGCATQGKPPPTISLDEPVQAQALPDPPPPLKWWRFPSRCLCPRS